MEIYADPRLWDSILLECRSLLSDYAQFIVKHTKNVSNNAFLQKQMQQQKQAPMITVPAAYASDLNQTPSIFLSQRQLKMKKTSSVAKPFEMARKSPTSASLLDTRTEGSTLAGDGFSSWPFKTVQNYFHSLLVKAALVSPSSVTDAKSIHYQGLDLVQWSMSGTLCV